MYVVMISESKIDEISFGNFLIAGSSKLYRWDHNSLGGSILLYIREDNPSNLLEVETKLIEDFYVGINLDNNKWLQNCSYDPHKSMIGNHLHALSEKIDMYSSSYDSFIILGDFNIEM